MNFRKGRIKQKHDYGHGNWIKRLKVKIYGFKDDSDFNPIAEKEAQIEELMDKVFEYEEEERLRRINGYYDKR